jgi:hypothetical protein
VIAVTCILSFSVYLLPSTAGTLYQFQACYNVTGNGSNLDTGPQPAAKRREAISYIYKTNPGHTTWILAKRIKCGVLCAFQEIKCSLRSIGNKCRLFYTSLVQSLY